MDDRSFSHHAKDEEVDEEDEGDYSSGSPSHSHLDHLQHPQQQQQGHHPQQQSQQPQLQQLKNFPGAKKETRSDFQTEGHIRAKFVKEWLLLNTEESEDSSISRNDLHKRFQEASAASITVDSATFGKYVRSVYPHIATRRLGKRGNSKYHYQGVRVRDTPLASLPSEIDSVASSSSSSLLLQHQTQHQPQQQQHQQQHQQHHQQHHQQQHQSSSFPKSSVISMAPSSSLPSNPSSTLLFNSPSSALSFPSSSSSSSSYSSSSHHHPHPPFHSPPPSTPLSIPSPFPTLFMAKKLVPVGGDPISLNPLDSLSRKRIGVHQSEYEAKRRKEEARSDFQAHFQAHMEALAGPLSTCNLNEAENCIKNFWRTVSQDRFASLNLDEILPALHASAEATYSRVISQLLPNPLNPPLPPTTQAIRHLGRNFEHHLLSALREVPAKISSTLLLSASNFGAELKQRASLSLLVHSASSVFFNTKQIDELAKTWEMVDLDALRDHIAWVLVGKFEVFDRFHSSFFPPPNLRGSISEWAQWLRALIVDFVDMSTPNMTEFLTTAKRFLLNWTFFGSLVTRDIAFKSASSFSTYQTLRMFTEEYYLFLLESRITELKKHGGFDYLVSDDPTFSSLSSLNRFPQGVSPGIFDFQARAPKVESEIPPQYFMSPPGFSNAEAIGASAMGHLSADLALQTRRLSTSNLIQLATPPNFADGSFTLPNFQRHYVPTPLHQDFSQ